MRQLVRTGVSIALLAVLAWSAALAFLYTGQDGMIFPAPPPKGLVAATGAFEWVVLETPDGERLNALHHTGEPGGDGVILFHGNGGDAISMLDSAHRYADAGYGVLIGEYRGYNGSTGSPSQDGLYTDGLAAFDYLASRGHSVIHLHGHSLGAAVAIHVAQNREAGSVALLAPFDSLLSVAQARYPVFPLRPLLRHPFPSSEKIAGVAEPIVIFHGDGDRTVPIPHGMALHRAAPPGTAFVPVRGAGHNNLVSFGVTDSAIDFFRSLAVEQDRQ